MENLLATFGKFLAKAAAAVVIALILYAGYKYLTAEKMEMVKLNQELMTGTVGIGSSSQDSLEQVQQETFTSPAVLPLDGDFNGAPVSGMSSSLGTPNAEVVPMDLLPNNQAATVFAAENPGSNVQNVDYLVAGFDQGIDTRGGSMKNPTLDIRPEPRIPKQFVGPWGNSTYEPDVYRKDICA